MSAIAASRSPWPERSPSLEFERVETLAHRVELPAELGGAAGGLGELAHPVVQSGELLRQRVERLGVASAARCTRSALLDCNAASSKSSRSRRSLGAAPPGAHPTAGPHHGQVPAAAPASATRRARIAIARGAPARGGGAAGRSGGGVSSIGGSAAAGRWASSAASSASSGRPLGHRDRAPGERRQRLGRAFGYRDRGDRRRRLGEAGRADEEGEGLGGARREEQGGVERAGGKRVARLVSERLGRHGAVELDRARLEALQLQGAGEIAGGVGPAHMHQRALLRVAFVDDQPGEGGGIAGRTLHVGKARLARAAAVRVADRVGRKVGAAPSACAKARTPLALVNRRACDAVEREVRASTGSMPQHRVDQRLDPAGAQRVRQGRDPRPAG